MEELQTPNVPVANKPTEVKPRRNRKKKPAKITEPVGSVDFDKVQSIGNPKARKDFIAKTVQDAGRPYFSISDALVNRSRGGYSVLAAFDKQIQVEARRRLPERTWRIKVLKYRNGKDPKPGDTIEWIIQRHHRANYGSGDKLTAQEAMEMKARGQGDQLTEMGEAKLDSDCCVELSYYDAVQLLAKHGVYYVTGLPLNPAQTQFNRSGKCNWLYVEVPPTKVTK